MRFKTSSRRASQPAIAAKVRGDARWRCPQVHDKVMMYCPTLWLSLSNFSGGRGGIMGALENAQVNRSGAAVHRQKRVRYESVGGDRRHRAGFGPTAVGR
jgi:hypothetical protein